MARDRDELAALGTLVVIAIGGGIVLGMMNAHRAAFDGFVYMIAGIAGALVGFVTAPLLVVAVYRKDWRVALPAIYGPSLSAAFVTSSEYGPGAGTLWTITTFCFACGLCYLVMPNGLLWEHRSTSITWALRWAPFVLLAAMAVPYHWVADPDFSTMSEERLTANLGSNDMGRQHDAARELASRGADAVRERAGHYDPRVRRGAARAARWLDSDARGAILIDLLDDSDRYVRLEVIAAIQWDIGSSGLPTLEARMVDEEEWIVKNALADAIAQLKLVERREREVEKLRAYYGDGPQSPYPAESRPGDR